MPRVSVIIPALDEAEGIEEVLDEIPRDQVDEVIVVDNGSHDRTSVIAERHGARVVREPQRGYGCACQTGIRALGETDVVVFLDADGSDAPAEIPKLIGPILQNRADFVVGSRMLGSKKRLMPIQAYHGDRFATTLIRLLFGFRYTDLGPFRAIRHDALEKLELRDQNYGWTAEMQVKAIKRGLRIEEMPVSYRRRRWGRSKITGTLHGTIRAGSKILYTIVKHRLINA